MKSGRSSRVSQSRHQQSVYIPPQEIVNEDIVYIKPDVSFTSSKKAIQTLVRDKSLSRIQNENIPAERVVPWWIKLLMGLAIVSLIVSGGYYYFKKKIANNKLKQQATKIQTDVVETSCKEGTFLQNGKCITCPAETTFNGTNCITIAKVKQQNVNTVSETPALIAQTSLNQTKMEAKTEATATQTETKPEAKIQEKIETKIQSPTNSTNTSSETNSSVQSNSTVQTPKINPSTQPTNTTLPIITPTETNSTQTSKTEQSSTPTPIPVSVTSLPTPTVSPISSSSQLPKQPLSKIQTQPLPTFKASDLKDFIHKTMTNPLNLATVQKPKPILTPPIVDSLLTHN